MIWLWEFLELSRWYEQCLSCEKVVWVYDGLWYGMGMSVLRAEHRGICLFWSSSVGAEVLRSLHD